jgi:hypothetical protein
MRLMMPIASSQVQYFEINYFLSLKFFCKRFRSTMLSINSQKIEYKYRLFVNFLNLQIVNYFLTFVANALKPTLNSNIVDKMIKTFNRKIL